MHPVFKVATRESIPGILQQMQQFNAIYRDPFDPAERARLLSEFLDTTQMGRLWQIEVDGTSVGYVVLAFGYSFEYHGRDAFIDELFIAENFRGCGLGGQTLDFIALQARELNIKTLHLEVEKSNKEARKLYKKKGYAGKDRMLLSRPVS